MHFRTNVKYMAYISDCLNEICNTNTITFGYRTHFLSQFTFKLHWAWNAFDCLLWVYGPGVMMVNIGTRVAPVNIAVSSLRNAALIERKVLQYTTFFLKKASLYLERRKNPTFYIVTRPCLCLNTLRGSETTLKLGLFNNIYW